MIFVFVDNSYIILDLYNSIFFNFCQLIAKSYHIYLYIFYLKQNNKMEKWNANYLRISIKKKKKNKLLWKFLIVYYLNIP